MDGELLVVAGMLYERDSLSSSLTSLEGLDVSMVLDSQR